MYMQKKYYMQYKAVSRMFLLMFSWENSLIWLAVYSVG
jgi:hypothetical protein